MAALGSIYYKEEDLQRMLDTVRQKGEKGMKVTISVKDVSNEYGQNIEVYHEQTKEQQINKEKKLYYGRGNIFWTDGKIERAVKPEKAPF